jgi:GNAT superfamily N-acetyltransferase
MTAVPSLLWHPRNRAREVDRHTVHAAPLTLRQSTPDDEPLLLRLFTENKARELAGLHLPDVQLAPLLTMQYRVRRTGYASTHPEARQLVVEEGSIPVGQVLLSEAPASIHIVDIAIAPAHQSKGLGTAVLRTLQQHAANIGKTLRLQVATNSPAHALYKRLGFIVTAHDVMIQEMVWSPESWPSR